MEHNREQHAQLQRRIMRNIRIVFYVRKFTSSFALKVYTLAIGIAVLPLLVSVKNVIKNMPALVDVQSVYTFSSSAILYTEASVQLVLAFISIAFVWLIRDVIRGSITHTTPASQLV